MYLNKQTKTTPSLPDTFCVGRSAFTKDQKNKWVVIRKYHNHTLQTKTRPDIIIHFIKQRDQFHFERNLYAQKCLSVSVSFVPNVVVQHVNFFVVCCVETTHYKRKVPSYVLVMWHTMLVSVYAIIVILWGTVTGHNYSPFCNVAVKINVFPDFFGKIIVAKQKKLQSWKEYRMNANWFT